MIRRISVVVVLIFATSLHAEGRRRVVAFPPPFPPCAMITGSAAVTFSRDHGATLAPTAERLSGIGYTYGLAALDTPSTLLAWHKSDLILSNDDGCSWRVVATFDDYDFPPRIVAAKGGRAYAWSDNRVFFVRFDSRGATKLKQPVAFYGVGVDPRDGDHVRAGGEGGSVWDSRDGGETWNLAGSVRADGQLSYYRFAFDPNNLDHIVAGSAVSGAFVSNDGGVTWIRSKIADRVNVFELAISPADPNIVWAEGIDLADEVRHVYRSTDGGATFDAVVDQSDVVHLINGNLLAPHPTNPDVLYFVFGTYFQNYGTDLYRYDASRRTLTIAHNDANDINAIAFSPGRPNLMYLGLEVESGVR